jgi:hypothetical protein
MKLSGKGELHFLTGDSVAEVMTYVIIMEMKF